MKTNKYPVLLSIIFFSFVSTSYADVFGTDDKKWERVFSDLKKISIRLTDNVDVQLKSLQTSQAEVLRLIDGLKNTIPALQGAIEQNDAKTTQQLSKLEGRLAELEGRTRAQLADLDGKTKAHLDEQRKSQTETANALKQALAIDMENLAKQNQSSLQAFSKSNSESQATINSGFVNIDNNNKKMIDILAKTLQENQETGKTVGSVSKKMGEVNDHINVTRDMVAKLKEIISANQGAIQAQGDQNSRNIEKLTEILKGLQAQNTALTASLQQVDEKITQSMLKSDPANANLDLANQKLSKLIEILKAFAGDQEKIVKSQQAISDSLRDFASEQERMGKKQQAISETLNEMRGKADSQEPKKSSKSQKKSEGKSKKSTED